ncbi:hypothetical protein BGX33_006317 [Mortierella sp. NVP41]|nr:hypothetical protein BGX33_006317 [Mortierella sp. NVP41]
MPPASLRKLHEVTLNVVSPILDNHGIKTIESQVCAGNAVWIITLTRMGSVLKYLSLGTGNRTRTSTTTTGCMSSLFPRSVFLLKSPSTQKICKTVCQSNTTALIRDDAYVFNIVLTQHETVERILSSRILKYKNFEKLIQDEEAHQHLIYNARLFKKDIDVKSNVGSDANLSDDDSDFTTTGPSFASDASAGPLVFNIKEFSFPTMCALLYYIYTDEINLSIDPARFAVTAPKENPSIGCHLDRTCLNSADWCSLDDRSPWMVMDVSWDQLMGAAGYFEIWHLHGTCRGKIIEGINDSTAVKTLFSSSVC